MRSWLVVCWRRRASPALCVCRWTRVYGYFVGGLRGIRRDVHRVFGRLVLHWRLVSADTLLVYPRVCELNGDISRGVHKHERLVRRLLTRFCL